MIHYWIFKYLNYRQALKAVEHKERITFDIFKSTFNIAKKNIFIISKKHGLKVYLVYYAIPCNFNNEIDYYIDFSFIDYIKFIFFFKNRKRKKEKEKNNTSYVILSFLQKECEKEIEKCEKEVAKAKKNIMEQIQ